MSTVKLLASTFVGMLIGGSTAFLIVSLIQLSLLSSPEAKPAWSAFGFVLSIMVIAVFGIGLIMGTVKWIINQK